VDSEFRRGKDRAGGKKKWGKGTDGGNFELRSSVLMSRFYGWVCADCGGGLSSFGDGKLELRDVSNWPCSPHGEGSRCAALEK
jgi:hypothetical protein